MVGHIPVQFDKKDMLSEQTGEIEHLTGYARLTSNLDTISAQAISQNYSVDKLKEAAAKTKEYNIWDCPTLIATGIKTDIMFCKKLPAMKLRQKLKPVLSWWMSQGYVVSPEEEDLWEF